MGLLMTYFYVDSTKKDFIILQKVEFQMDLEEFEEWIIFAGSDESGTLDTESLNFH